MSFLKCCELVVFVVALIGRCSLAEFGSDPLADCADVDVNFELITGYVFTAPDSILDTRPGVLKLETCIQACKKNSSCRAVNYETGLCVLFTSSAEIEPGNLNFTVNRKFLVMQELKIISHYLSEVLFQTRSTIYREGTTKLILAGT